MAYDSRSMTVTGAWAGVAVAASGGADAASGVGAGACVGTACGAVVVSGSGSGSPARAVLTAVGGRLGAAVEFVAGAVVTDCEISWAVFGADSTVGGDGVGSISANRARPETNADGLLDDSAVASGGAEVVACPSFVIEDWSVV